MFVTSLLHWIFSLVRYSQGEKNIVTWANGLGSFEPHGFLGFTYSLAPGVLFAINVVASDIIVLWRMCVVWDNSRPAIIFGVLLAVMSLALNVANLIAEGSNIIVHLGVEDPFDFTEYSPAYDTTALGFFSGFASLASNLCATCIVGWKAWLHRRQLAEFARFNNRRTLAVRVMELLVESGIVYTTIWALYCSSFFDWITYYPTSDPGFAQCFIVCWISAVEYLDLTMIQITCIYPLAIFLLVALDKLHYSHPPELLSHQDLPIHQSQAVTVSFEVAVERSIIVPDSTRMVTAIDGGRGGGRQDTDHTSSQ
ncbi:hypothetical protein PENSPDRAFT_694313 [Peniophora sp. CONT]|nr:hypothetical protein PENSPDRAFT_694313 [Peniophora sp. CONT]